VDQAAPEKAMAMHSIVHSIRLCGEAKTRGTCTNRTKEVIIAASMTAASRGSTRCVVRSSEANGEYPDAREDQRQLKSCDVRREKLMTEARDSGWRDNGRILTQCGQL
jgi:hypothetical protein